MPATAPGVHSGDSNEPANVGLIVAVVAVAAIVFGAVAFLVVKKNTKK